MRWLTEWWLVDVDARKEALRGGVIGAKEEGILRSHVITATGRVRDSVYYSILAAEWPEVKAGLEAKLAR